MCNWRKWIWPGILAVLILTALATWFRLGVVEADLAARVSGALSTKHPWAGVSPDGRDLTLTGTSPLPEDTASALELAHNVYGVRIVIDKSGLVPVASPYRFSAAKQDGKITLGGNAPNEAARASIIAAAKQSSPGFSVADNITLARRAPKNYLAAANHATSLLPLLETGQVTLSGTTLSVAGSTVSPDDFEAADAMAKSLPDGFSLGEAEIAPPPAAAPPAAIPYRWSVSKHRSGISIRGNAKSAESASDVVAMVKSAFGADGVNDKQVIASGSPEGFGTVQKFIVDLLGRLDAGQGNLVGNAVSVSGKAGSKAVADAVSNAMKNALPAGFTGSTNILFEPAVSQEAVACEALIASAIDGREIKFATNRTLIEKSSGNILADVVKAAQKCPSVRIEISGYTDDVGAERFNQKLSEGRAKAVRKYLVDAGIPASRLDAKGYGETSPAVPNDSDEGRAQNRRIEFKATN